MIDTRKEYWWGKFRKLYRGPGCSMGYPRHERMSKPVFHAWTSVSRSMLYLFVAYGWWSYQVHMKIPVWLGRTIKWYKVWRKRKAP